MHRQPAFHLAISFIFAAAIASAVHAQTAPATQPAPLLEQISQQTQSRPVPPRASIRQRMLNRIIMVLLREDEGGQC